MLEQVENKIQELKKLRAEEYYKKKDADLKAWGLTAKVDGKKVSLNEIVLDLNPHSEAKINIKTDKYNCKYGSYDYGYNGICFFGHFVFK